MRALLRTAGIASLALVACVPKPAAESVDRAEIERLLDAYRGALVQAYSTDDAERLSEVAMPRERVRIANQIDALVAGGTSLRPILKRATIESLEFAGRTSLLVVSTEIWDLRTVALGSDRTVGESLDQENRVEYTLIREEGRWWVLSRNLRSSSADT